MAFHLLAILRLLNQHLSISFVDSDGTNQIGKLRQVADTVILSARNNTAYGNFKFTGEDGSTEKLDYKINGATGDISFYEDTGTTAKLFWDASAERLGIGSSFPAATLDVVKTGAGIQDTLQLRNAQTLAAGVGSSLALVIAAVLDWLISLVRQQVPTMTTGTCLSTQELLIL